MHPSGEPASRVKEAVCQKKIPLCVLRLVLEPFQPRKKERKGDQHMGSLNYNLEQKGMLDRLLLDQPEVSAGVVFGLPCYKINGVVFATLYGEGVGIKLPEARVRELLEQPGFVPFRPFGRNRGKEFVQITHENPEDYQHDKPLFEEAMRYAFSASANQKEPSLPRLSLGGDMEEQRFRSIAALLTSENSAITVGKMMSEPALQYQGKVFAFYYGKKMVFRLGRDFQPELFDIQHYCVLAPFKTKPPMVDWFEIPFDDQHRWEELSRYALGLLTEH
jgi:hypothetical protein